MRLIKPGARPYRAVNAMHSQLRRLHQKSFGSSYRKTVRATAFLLVTGVFVMASVAPAIAIQPPPAADKDIEASISELEQFADKTKDKALKELNLKGGLQDALERRGFHWMWWQGKHWKTCKAVHKLTKLLERIDSLRQRYPGQTLDDLFVKIWTLRNDILLSLPAGENCGFGDTGTEPKVNIGESDNKHVTFDVSFSMPMLTRVKGGNDGFTQVHMTGIDNMAGTPGEPAVPVWRQMVAVPEGATARLKMAEPERRGGMHINLVPFQEQAVDQTPSLAQDDKDIPPEPDMDTFADPPFVLNQETYRTDRFVPPNPCTLTPMGQYRDIQMAQVECATGQYNPVSDEYLMFRGFDLEVVFEGGRENFITNRTFGPFEPSADMTAEATLNKAVLKQYARELDLSVLQCSGEELLILTHGDFREAADRLADHKRNKGISTNVFNVGVGVPSRDTAEEIDDFIENRYDTCKVRPSYVLLLGDAEFIPTFYPAGFDNVGSDYPYSTYVQFLLDAFFPDFGTGRIPVDTLAQADTVVDKIVKYESTPPNLGLGNGAPFYTNVGLASQFQGFRMNADGTPLNGQHGTDQRAFIETTELVRNELLDRGYTAPRIYTKTVDDGGYCLQENANGDCILTQAPYNGNETPRRYYNGTLLPASIGAGSGFAWNGNTTDIANAWNNGRFLFLHRDHGWPNGWGSPGFSSSNVDNLSNGDLLPVVFSINCASGIFDNETAGGVYGTTNNGVYFAERALRKADGGAIGVIGDTRNSPTWANNALTRGFFDAVWPDTVPTFGGNTQHKRLGDILNWGKVYLASQVGAPQTAGSVTPNQMGLEYNIWHVIGDPTLEMWTGNPYKLNLPLKFFAEFNPFGEILHYEQEGAIITKLQISPDGEVRAIGRAEVHDGKAEMDYFERPNEQFRTIYTANLNDAVSVVLTPEGGAPGPRSEE